MEHTDSVLSRRLQSVCTHCNSAAVWKRFLQVRSRVRRKNGVTARSSGRPNSGLDATIEVGIQQEYAYEAETVCDMMDTGFD